MWHVRCCFPAAVGGGLDRDTNTVTESVPRRCKLTQRNAGRPQSDDSVRKVRMLPLNASGQFELENARHSIRLKKGAPSFVCCLGSASASPKSAQLRSVIRSNHSFTDQHPRGLGGDWFVSRRSDPLRSARLRSSTASWRDAGTLLVRLPLPQGVPPPGAKSTGKEYKHLATKARVRPQSVPRTCCTDKLDSGKTGLHQPNLPPWVYTPPRAT